MLLVILSSPSSSIHTYALTKRKGSAISFINSHLTSMHRFYLYLLDSLIILRVVNGHAILSRQIVYYVKIIMRIAQHIEEIMLLVMTLGHYPVVLGTNYL